MMGEEKSLATPLLCVSSAKASPSGADPVLKIKGWP